VPVGADRAPNVIIFHEIVHCAILAHILRLIFSGEDKAHLTAFLECTVSLIENTTPFQNVTDLIIHFSPGLISALNEPHILVHTIRTSRHVLRARAQRMNLTWLKGAMGYMRGRAVLCWNCIMPQIEYGLHSVCTTAGRCGRAAPRLARDIFPSAALTRLSCPAEEKASEQIRIVTNPVIVTVQLQRHYLDNSCKNVAHTACRAS